VDARHVDEQRLGAADGHVVPAEPVHQVEAEVERRVDAAAAEDAAIPFGEPE
jgi:hypothetical protein